MVVARRFNFATDQKEFPMYMLLIDGKINAGKKNEFVNAWQSQILPLLKKQNGFVDEILLFENATPQSCVGLCLWKTQADGEHYHREVFPKAKDFVQHLLNGAPAIRGFDVEAAETFRIAAGKAA
jgi:uncharacterized protein (UPF0371 family)